MPSLSITQKLLFLIGVGAFLYFLVFHYQNTPLAQHSPFPTFSASSSALVALLPSPSPSEMSCLSEEDVSKIAGIKLTLINTTFTSEIDRLNCSYQSPDLVKDITPSLSYVLQRNPDPEEWSTSQQNVSKKSGYRTIAENSNIFAEINPVLEVSQGTFYGRADNSYIELSYSPIKLPIGDILLRGVKLTEAVLSSQPKR